MEYFSEIPNIYYSFDPENNDVYVVKNLFARVKFLNEALNNASIYYEYVVKDGDTPESIAHKYYGDSKRHWIVLFANQIVDPYFDFPLNTRDLEANIIKKYGSLANAQAILHHVEQRTVVSTDSGGNITRLSSNATLNSAFTYDFSSGQMQYITLPTIGPPEPEPEILYSSSEIILDDGTIVSTTVTLNAVSNYEYEVNQNEKKRTIRLLDRQYASLVELQLKNLLAQ